MTARTAPVWSMMLVESESIHCSSRRATSSALRCRSENNIIGTLVSFGKYDRIFKQRLVGGQSIHIMEVRDDAKLTFFVFVKNSQTRAVSFHRFVITCLRIWHVTRRIIAVHSQLNDAVEGSRQVYIGNIINGYDVNCKPEINMRGMETGRHRELTGAPCREKLRAIDRDGAAERGIGVNLKLNFNY